MRKILFIISFIVCVGFLGAQSFVHPGAMNTKKDLDFMKSKLAQNAEPWDNAWDKMLTTKAASYQGINPKPYGSLDYVPHPRASVDCGSFNNPNRGCNDIVYDGMAAYTLAIRFYVTGDQRYASKSMDIITSWSNIYRRNTESNSRLVVSWATPWYVNAAEILRYTPGSGWTSTETNKMNTLLNRFKEYIFWEDRPNNNWMMSSVEARIAVAIFQDDRVAYNNAVGKWKQRVKTYIYQRSDRADNKPVPPAGMTLAWTERIWHDGDRRTGTRYVDGLCYETCRDISHVKLGVISLLNGAEMAWSQGDDLFSIEKERFKDFFELHAPWMMKETTPPNDICDGFLDIISEEGFEIGYNHLHDRLGMNLPNTKRMLLRNRPNSANRWVSKWETLCYADRPFGTTPLNEPPVGEFVNPTFNSIEEGYNMLYVKVDASDPNGDAISLKLMIDGQEIRSEASAPYEWGHVSTSSDFTFETLGLGVGSHLLQVIITDSKGASTTISKTIIVTEKGVTLFTPIHDAYIEGTASKNDGVLRVENGNRVSYLMFDVSQINSSEMVSASLTLSVADDNGRGSLKAFSASGSWTETELNPENKPVKGARLDTKLGDFNIGEDYTFDVSDMNIQNGMATIILEMDAGGNDVSFASKDQALIPKPILRIKTDEVTALNDNFKSERISVFPNPSQDGVFNLSQSLDYKVQDLQGNIISGGYGSLINLSSKPKGIYILKIGDQVAKLIW